MRLCTSPPNCCAIAMPRSLFIAEIPAMTKGSCAYPRFAAILLLSACVSYFYNHHELIWLPANAAVRVLQYFKYLEIISMILNHTESY